ncbi:MAG: YdcF family protein [Nanoarchaeota archaeon]
MIKDAIVILAHSVNPDGSLPQIPRYRVEKGVDLFKKGLAKKIIMSGSCGFMVSYTPTKTEAKAMKEYAVSLGVPEKNILTEEDSKDTIGNAYFTRKNLLEPNNWKNIIVVTSEYHIPRARYIFQKILRKDNRVEMIAADSHLTAEEARQKSVEEEKIMALTKQWLDWIEDGDVEEITRFMTETHPAYAKNPKITKQELKRMLLTSQHA